MTTEDKMGSPTIEIFGAAVTNMVSLCCILRAPNFHALQDVRVLMRRIAPPDGNSPDLANMTYDQGAKWVANALKTLIHHLEGTT